MIIAALSFTLMNFWVKTAAQRFELNAAELVFWRMGFAALFLAATATIQQKTFTTPYWRTHLNRSISGTLGMFGIFYAVTHLPLSTGVTLGYTSPIFLAILLFIVLKERISIYTLSVLLLGFIGVVLLLNPSFYSGQQFAALVGLGGGLLSGWAYLQVRELTLLGEPSWRIVFYLSLVGVVLSAIWASFTSWQLPPINALPYLVGIGTSALAAQLCMTQAYKIGNKFAVASLSYLTVVFASLAGILFLGDKISWQEILGMGIIIASGILSSINPLKQQNAQHN